jgi:hypothetical protein
LLVIIYCQICPKMSNPESKAINEKLGIGNNVLVYHLPTYTRYNVTTKPDGTQVFNPAWVSKLCATLAVANTDPANVQRFVIHKLLILRLSFAFFVLLKFLSLN